MSAVIRPKAVFALALSLAAIFFASPAQAEGSGAARTPSVSVDDKLALSYRAMYDLKFSEAFKAADEAKALAQDDPLPSVAQAWVAFFRELDRLHALRSEVFATDDNFHASRNTYVWDSANKKVFDDALAQTEKLAQARLSRDQNDPRALLALALANGLHGDDLGLFSKKDMSALSYVKSATSYAERLLALSPDSYDAYVATGLGKYIIGRRSAPVRWVLRMGGYKGDEDEGIRELSLAADHARYLAPFASILVAFEDIRRNNSGAARKKLEQLHEQFPHNPLFVEEMNKLGRTSARASSGRSQQGN